MPLIKRLAIALTGREIERFVPARIYQDMLALADRTVHFDVGRTSSETFYSELMRFDPTVLVGCWTTPQLPMRLPPSLGYVCYLAGSVRKLTTRTHLENGLIITNWGGSISRVVAEHALMLTLGALRRAGHWIPAMKSDGVWKPEHLSVETDSLFARRVGIHGFGRVARELTKLLRPFDVSICVHAPEEDPDLYAAYGCKRVGCLEELFAGSDVVYELAPLIPATTRIITEKLLRLIPSGGVFINVGRGGVVDEAALVTVASEGKILIGLDVYENEPLPRDSALRSMPNVLLTPHLGGPTMDRCRDAGGFGLENLRAYAEGRPLSGLVTPAIFDGSS